MEHSPQEKPPANERESAPPPSGTTRRPKPANAARTPESRTTPAEQQTRSRPSGGDNGNAGPTASDERAANRAKRITDGMRLLQLSPAKQQELRKRHMGDEAALLREIKQLYREKHAGRDDREQG